jgi:hypothetical protein
MKLVDPFSDLSELKVDHSKKEPETLASKAAAAPKADNAWADFSSGFGKTNTPAGASVQASSFASWGTTPAASMGTASAWGGSVAAPVQVTASTASDSAFGGSHSNTSWAQPSSSGLSASTAGAWGSPAVAAPAPAFPVASWNASTQPLQPVAAAGGLAADKPHAPAPLSAGTANPWADANNGNWAAWPPTAKSDASSTNQAPQGWVAFQ